MECNQCTLRDKLIRKLQLHNVKLLEDLEDILKIVYEFRASGLALGSEYVSRLDKAEQAIPEAE